MDRFETSLQLQGLRCLDLLGFNTVKEIGFLGESQPLEIPISFSPIESPPSVPDYRPASPSGTLIMPGVDWRGPSRNFNQRGSHTVDMIVLHHTEGGSYESNINVLLSSPRKVSAHFVIGKDGRIAQLLSLNLAGQHVGGWGRDVNQKGYINSRSVGIEMVNKGDGRDPWTPAQVAATVRVIQYIISVYPIKQIAGHHYLDKGKEYGEPKGFPWASLRHFNIPLYYTE